MSDKIKKFNDFMAGSNMRRFMNHLAIEGYHKSWFLGKPKKFELHIYYTQVKNVITDMKIYSELKLKELDLPFELGDKIDVVREWVEKNGYEITFDLNRNH
jgi:alpha-acetolactate decarboxylase